MDKIRELEAARDARPVDVCKNESVWACSLCTDWDGSGRDVRAHLLEQYVRFELRLFVCIYAVLTLLYYSAMSWGMRASVFEMAPSMSTRRRTTYSCGCLLCSLRCELLVRGGSLKFESELAVVLERSSNR